MNDLALLGGRLRWLPDAPRPSEDAVWLAAAVPPLAAGTAVLDLGCGNGLVGLALAQWYPGLVLQGLELNPTRVEEARQHAALNGLIATFTLADALTWQAPQRFPVVVCNPPFHALARGHHSPNPAKALAHGLPALTPWLQAILKALTPGGTCYLVLHSSLETALLAEAQTLGGSLHTRPLATHPTRPAKRLLACWRPVPGQVFQVTSLPVVPAYHTPLREAVLRQGGCLAAQGYGW